jgi:tRNA U55 pseudouridine synthase TruB
MTRFSQTLVPNLRASPTYHNIMVLQNQLYVLQTFSARCAKIPSIGSAISQRGSPAEKAARAEALIYSAKNIF